MNVTIYASDKYKQYVSKATAGLRFLKSVRVKYFENCDIIIDSKSQKFGVFDSKHRFISNSTQQRNKNVQSPPMYVVPSDSLDIDAVYLGTLENHFGHFLLEHTTRMYAVLKPECRGKKYIIVNNRQLSDVQPFVWEFLSLLGISPDNVFIVNQSTKVRSLYIPDVGFEIPDTSSRQFAALFDSISDSRLPEIRADKVYVSRMKLSERSTFGEEQIQNIFEKNGFTVIYPECLTLTEQVAYMKNCKCLAGIAGSALHLSLLMPSGGTVVQIKRNKLLRDNVDTQHALCSTKGCDLVVVDCAAEKLPTHHWSEFPQIIAPTKYFVQFLRDAGFSCSPSDLEMNQHTRQQYRKAFRQKGGFIRYQIKRMLVYFLPRLMPTSAYKESLRRWLNRRI